MGNIKDRLSLLSIDTENPNLELVNQINDTFPGLHQLMLSIPDKSQCGTNRSVLLIGGGIIGLLTAFYLSLEGFQVTLLEQESYGAAASGRNGGGILALGRDFHEIPLIKISIDLWEQLSGFDIETQFVRSGHVMIAMNEYEAQKLGKAQELYQRAGLETQWIEPKQALQKLPDLSPQNFGGLSSSSDAQGYPFITINSLVKKLKSLGCQLINHCKVTGFKVVNDKVTSVATDQGDFHADEVVLCTGPWTEKLGSLLDVHLPIQPRRSPIMVTEIVHTRRMDPFVSGNNLYMRQTHAGNILFGGGGSWEPTGFNVSGSVDVIKRLSTYFTELFPSFQALHLIRSFAGTVEITPDHRPLLGIVSPYTNLHVSAGYSGHGYGMSAFAAKLLAKQLLYKALEQDLPQSLEVVSKTFSPSRLGGR
ncbi:MAG: FAD-binding oxidoreductase [Paenibacillaceae bacterium]